MVQPNQLDCGRENEHGGGSEGDGHAHAAAQRLVFDVSGAGLVRVKQLNAVHGKANYKRESGQPGRMYSSDTSAPMRAFR